MPSVIMPYSPATNTPGAALARGDTFYRLLESITLENSSVTSALVWPSDVSIVGAAIGPRSSISRVRLSYVDIGSFGVSGSGVLHLDARNPFIAPIPANPRTVSNTVTTVSIEPLDYFPAGGPYLLDVFLYFRPPFKFPSGRPDLNVLSANVAGASGGSTAPFSFGRRKFTVSARNLGATAHKLDISVNTVGFETSGQTFTAGSELVDSYTFTGTVGDAFNRTYDFPATNCDSIQYSVATAGTGLYISIDVQD